MTHFFTESIDNPSSIITDSDEIDWDSAEVVTLTDEYADFFDMDQFYSLPATVTKEIEQTYHQDGEAMSMIKPGDELRKSRMTLESVPLTLSHPSSGRVMATDDIQGIVGEPEYDSSEKALNANIYIPTDNEKAKSFMDEHEDVSVGFYSELDTDSTPTQQRNIVFDHLSIVEHGRCNSDDDGCSIQKPTTTYNSMNMNDSTTDCDGGIACTCDVERGELEQKLADTGKFTTDDISEYSTKDLAMIADLIERVQTDVTESGSAEDSTVKTATNDSTEKSRPQANADGSMDPRDYYQ